MGTGYQIEVFKILQFNGCENIDSPTFFSELREIIRGHDFTLVKQQRTLDDRNINSPRIPSMYGLNYLLIV